MTDDPTGTARPDGRPDARADSRATAPTGADAQRADAAPQPPTDTDLAAVTAQLGRPVRGVVDVAHRCPCGLPDVVATAPRLPDGTPFPTTYYLTCPRAASAIGTLEADGLMKQMSARLATDDGLAAGHRAAHEDYLRRRADVGARSGVGDVAEIAGVSAGGMPDRVKCLHVLAGHALAAGPGVSPLGDETLAALPAWWREGPCVPQAPARVAAQDAAQDAGLDVAHDTADDGDDA